MQCNAGRMHVYVVYSVHLLDEVYCMERHETHKSFPVRIYDKITRRALAPRQTDDDFQQIVHSHTRARL